MLGDYALELHPNFWSWERMNITFGDMAEGLYQLRNKYGLYYNPSEYEILQEAINSKNST